MQLEQFNFELPDGLIATRPMEPREHARLLHVSGSELADKRVSDFVDLLTDQDMLVFNNTKVIPALLFGKIGEGNIECTLHTSITPSRWRAFAKPARRAKTGSVIRFSDRLLANVIENLGEGELVLEFTNSDTDLLAILERDGNMPLPPYIRKKRAVDARDAQDYQSIFAQHAGAVASPTASLHFTPALIEQLTARGVKISFITLHVGAGTFLPVKTTEIKDHKMHREYYEISESSYDAISTHIADGGRVVPVGTTSLRALEGCVQTHGKLIPTTGSTEIFITPGFRFQIADRLITNFHLPQSTLFMLVCAFSGFDVMHSAYRHAISQHYRFFSYGDASLLERAI